jgi:peptidoglycan/xylan/chitin deacetylase (PgdA/CDA1 family)
MQAQLDQMQAQLDEANMINELNNARVVQLDAENQDLKSRVPPPPAPAGPAPGNNQVVLTFDDGPHGTYTRQVMDVLEANGIRGVFFMVGTEVEAHPDIAKEIVTRGHVVANHSWRHADLMKLSDDEIREDLTRTSDAIERATGVRPKCLRPPYGNADDRVKAVAQSVGLSSVKWNVDTLDYQKAGSGAIASKALGQINGLGERGANVLMHDGGGDRSQTVGALNQMIQEIKASGRQFVTICG